jgi:hypothetical protein
MQELANTNRLLRDAHNLLHACNGRTNLLLVQAKDDDLFVVVQTVVNLGDCSISFLLCFFHDV